jgi:hypothetical protein
VWLSHPLHLAVAEAIKKQLNGRGELIRDPACGGNQQLPRFVGPHKGRDTRMCCVDLLVISSGQVRVIVEIEESGFLPTKICGKFFQSALATHFIHDSRPEVALPYADEVLFIQVLDGSKCLRRGTRKKAQADLIAREIRKMITLKWCSIKNYQLFFVTVGSYQNDLDSIALDVSKALFEQALQADEVSLKVDTKS